MHSEELNERKRNWGSAKESEMLVQVQVFTNSSLHDHTQLYTIQCFLKILIEGMFKEATKSKLN